MRRHDREPRQPLEREETIRKSIIDLIEVESLSSKEISGYVRISEKEVYEHLGHIQKTMSHKNRKVGMTAPRCKQCGFKFKKRDRMKKPGKCPICRNESIEEATFFITI